MTTTLWMSVVLLATHAYGTLNPEAPPQTEHWGQLAGVWRCELVVPQDDGTTRVRTATWTWEYILDGYAVRDRYASDDSPFRGTGLRVFNAARGTWEVAWTANTSSNAMTVTRYEATSTPDEVVMTYADGKEPAWRTVFSAIEDDSFEWTNEPSGQRITCRRR